MRAPFQVLVIPFRNSSAGPEYAVFMRSAPKYWQFVSGGGENAETPIQAAIRETKEEIGVADNGRYFKLNSMTTIPKNCFSASNWGPEILVIPEHSFAVNVGESTFSLSSEHTEFRWASYDDAYTLLRWDSNRNALWELRERLNKTRF